MRKPLDEVKLRGPRTDDYAAAMRIYGTRCQVRIPHGDRESRCLQTMECVLKIGTHEPVPCCADHRRHYLGKTKAEKQADIEEFLRRQVPIFGDDDGG